MFCPIFVFILVVIFSGTSGSFIYDILGDPTDAVSSVRSYTPPGGIGMKLNCFFSIFLLDFSFLNIGFGAVGIL